MKRVYISGPMTGLPNLNFAAFTSEAARLRALGYEVVNPAELHTDSATSKSWEECMRVDLQAMLDCDTVATLPGWQRSRGAHLEIHVAHRLALTIVDAAAITFPWAPSAEELAGVARAAGC